MRMELAPPQYSRLEADTLPYTFDLSAQAIAEPAAAGSAINIIYPALRAICYCSYLTGKDEWQAALAESRSFVIRHAKQPEDIREKAYTDSGAHIYASLFLLEGDVASPIQFTLTDSLSRVFRGALFYDVKPNADSLAPVTDYLRDDIIHLMQSFRWK